MPDIAMYLSDVDVVEEQPGKASRECYLPVAFAEVKDGNVTPAVCSPQLGWAQASACLALLTAGFDESEIVVPGFSFCGPIYNLEIMMVRLVDGKVTFVSVSPEIWKTMGTPDAGCKIAASVAAVTNHYQTNGRIASRLIHEKKLRFIRTAAGLKDLPGADEEYHDHSGAIFAGTEATT
ncbi:hypothetical protein HK097_008541, partial [Rhizophlyctis rosea]